MAIIYIVILIGVLVFVHEFGHYIAAKLFRVKVESFSIGFGPRLFGFRKWNTNWDVRILPLGGFVQMYGTEFEEVTDKTDPDFENAYNNKPIWQKAIINLAGPLFNLLFPIPILFAVYLGTVTSDLPPNIGQVLDNTPAVGVFEPGDRVVEINGTDIRYWTQLHDEIADNPERELAVTVERDGKRVELAVTPVSTTLRDAMDVMTETIGRVGITPDFASPVIGIARPMSPAAAAGLQNFDEITAVNGRPVRTYVELDAAVRHNTESIMTFEVLRPQALDVPYGSVSVLVPHTVQIPINLGDIDIIAMAADAANPKHTRTNITCEKLGIASANMFLSEVDPDSPAGKAGLLPGDRILELDGVSINLFRSLLDKLAQTWDTPHTLTVQRGSIIFKTEIQLEKLMITGEFQEEYPIIYAGFYNKMPIISPERVDKTWGDRFAYAARVSFTTTVKASTMLVVYVVRMFQGRVSTKALGGPILIGHMASKAGADGIDAFLRMMAIISINLGILNLLPIPLFDGGKLAILAVEAVKRGPLSMRTRQIIAYVGLAMVALLLMLAFKNDIERMWNLLFS